MPSHPHRLAALLAGATLLISLSAASCGDQKSTVTLGAATLGTVDEIVEAPGSVTARAAA
ncbi:MAG: HlyD family secretion protein, partial [Actinoplanes sp.]|nr:HlyD family secretion protein [Actinoplanes sp.]